MSNVAVHKVREANPSHPFLHQMADLLDGVRTRAFDLFQKRGGADGNDLGDWLAAEKEMLQVPAVELAEKDGEFQLQVALPGYDAKDVSVAVLPDRVIVEGESDHRHNHANGTVHVCEFTERRAFRQIPLPKAVDVDHVSATLDKGVLHVRAAIAEQERSRGAAA